MFLLSKVNTWVMLYIYYSNFEFVKNVEMHLINIYLYVFKDTFMYFIKNLERQRYHYLTHISRYIIYITDNIPRLLYLYNEFARIIVLLYLYQNELKFRLLFFIQFVVEVFDMYFIIKDVFRIKKTKLPRLIRYNQYIKYNQDKCIFCYMPFYRNELISELHCGHVFHTSCLIEYLRRTSNCPVCRQ